MLTSKGYGVLKNKIHASPEARAKKFWIFYFTMQFSCKESYLPDRAGRSKKLPALLNICLPGAGGQAVVSKADYIIRTYIGDTVGRLHQIIRTTKVDVKLTYEYIQCVILSTNDTIHYLCVLHDYN